MNPRIENARERLLTHGRAALLRDGYARLNIKSLSESCGMAAGTFYHYFENKAALGFCVVDAIWDDTLLAIDEVLDSNLPFLDKMDASRDALRSFKEALDRISLGFPIDAKIACDRRSRRITDLEDRVRHLVESEVEAGRMTTDTLDVATLEAAVVGCIGVESAYGIRRYEALTKILDVAMVGEEGEERQNGSGEHRYHDGKALTDSALAHIRLAQGAKLIKTAFWTYDIEADRITMDNDEGTLSECAQHGWPMVFENASETTQEFIEEQDRAKYSEMMREVRAGRDASCDVWYVQKMGVEPRCERESYVVVRDSSGKPVRAYGMGLNVTAEKKVEERYEREVGYLRQNDDNNLVAKGHYNLTQNLVLEYTTKNDRIYRVSPGTSYDDAYKSFTRMAYAEDERAQIRDRLDRRVLLDRYQKGDLATSVEYRRVLDDGLPLWVSMDIHTYMMPETGDVECFTYAYDVSDKMLANEVMGLISTEEFDYIGLIFAASDGYEHIKKSPAVQFPAEREVASYSECCKRVLTNNVSEDEARSYAEAISLDNILAGLEKNGRHTSVYRRTQDGTQSCKQLDYVWFDQHLKIILVVRTDVTAVYEREQRQLRAIEEAKLEADRANEAKSSFLSGLSHDIRTPLNGIIGFTEFALAEDDPQKARDYMGNVKSSADLLLGIVNDVLDLSRIESGKMVLDPKPTPAKDIGAAVAKALRPSAEAKGVDLIVESYPDKMVYVDKLKYQKIWLNLLSNAIKYTPRGGTVRMRVEPIDPPVDGHNRRLVVEDNGIGMSEEFQKTMFEPFSQERRSETTGIQGTGLGLSIVRRIVDLLGGTIKVDSKRGQGTRFEVEVHILPLEEGEAVKEELERKMTELSGRRLLLCEDNEMNADIARMLLSQRGVEVDWAADGSQGLATFEGSDPGHYDAILMDVHMPVMDGREATRAIRGLAREDAKVIPIIALTADAFEEDMIENHKAGMDAYVTKPVIPEQLYETLEEALATR